MTRVFWSGFVVGALLTLTYLTFGSHGWFYSPTSTWANIVFFPGLVAGHLFYDLVGAYLPDHSLAVNASVGIGVSVMAAIGGGLACGGYKLVEWILKKRRGETKE